MVVKLDEAVKQVAKHADFVMERNGDEWVGRSEETMGKKSEIRTLNIKYVKGGGADLIETITTKEKGSSEKWRETGTVVKKMRFDSLNKLQWADIEFVFGSWRYPVHIEVQKEDERIDRSSPDTVNTDFGPQKIEGRTKLFDVEETKVEGIKVKGTIFGYQTQDSIYATLSDRGNLISYTETTEGAIGPTTRITIHLERLYEKESKLLESFSADISVGDGVTEGALDASVHLESERAKLLNFRSQKPVEDWSREMELRTGNLK